jgi:hypothetical protein
MEPGQLHRYSYGLDGRGIGVQSLAGLTDVSLHGLQIDSEARLTSYPMDNQVSPTRPQKVKS